LRLIRVCREGEAIAVAAGLHIGGKRPLVMMQCTGLFEAGDSLRNFVHDLKLPLFFFIGVRSYNAFLKGPTADTCPVFTLPILDAWRLPHTFIDPAQNGVDLAAYYRQAQAAGHAAAALLAE
jgi:sulfopyruvate decarboxylase subunit alpha